MCYLRPSGVFFVIVIRMSAFVKAHSGAKIRIPNYDDDCIAQLPAFFQNTLLGNRDDPLTHQIANKVRLGGVKNVVFFLVDGFGATQWETYKPKYNALQRFEQDGYLGNLDSVFPSSTPVALNTLHANGLLPAQHGLIDWWLYVEEIDKIIATLPFAAMGSEQRDSLIKIGAKPSILLDNPTTYELFEKQGIKTRAFIPKGYLQSVCTKTTYKGSELVPYEKVSDLFAALSNELAKPQEKPSYNFVYLDRIDGTGHEFGPDSIEYERVVKVYFTALDDFLAKANDMKSTLFVISADHGQVNVGPKEIIYLDKLVDLSGSFRVSAQGNLILPWGGKREMFLAIKDDKQSEVLNLLQDIIGDYVEIVETERALKAGLFGHASVKHPHLKSRLGDVLVLPKGNKTVWYHHPDEEPYKLKGEHGGLSDAELKVPFGLLRLN